MFFSVLFVTLLYFCYTFCVLYIQPLLCSYHTLVNFCFQLFMAYFICFFWQTLSVFFLPYFICFFCHNSYFICFIYHTSFFNSVSDILHFCFRDTSLIFLINLHLFLMRYSICFFWHTSFGSLLYFICFSVMLHFYILRVPNMLCYDFI